MKKPYFLLVLLVLLGGMLTGDSGVQEEIDYLLFSSDSATHFINEEQAMLHLDGIAKYLLDRKLDPGQISVFGYAAAAVNDIDPLVLSRDRALFVMSELQKRGVQRELFSDPVAYGAVDIWGTNADEEGWSQNRRVRIMVDGAVLTPVLVQEAEPPVIAIVPDYSPAAGNAADDTGSAFPWLLFLILAGIALVAALLFLASGKKRKEPKTTEKRVQPQKEAAPQQPVEPVIAPVPPVVPKQAPVPLQAAAAEKIYILTDEEIRRHAYVLCERRSYQNGDATSDWYRSLKELTVLHESEGYRVIRS